MPVTKGGCRFRYDVHAGGSVEGAKRAVYEEKLREDRLRRAGAGVIWWGASDLARPALFARDVERQLHAQPGSTFRGRAVLRPRVA